MRTPTTTSSISFNLVLLIPHRSCHSISAHPGDTYLLFTDHIEETTIGKCNDMINVTLDGFGRGADDGGST